MAAGHGGFTMSGTEARQRAREALAPLPDGEMKTILSDIAEFYVSRAY